MSQKKRGSNPIRITLTEDQISDIIQSAAKTRRGLKVESLEDRIAPSAIGAPMFDPGLSGDGPPMPGLDPNAPNPYGMPGEPPLPGAGLTEGSGFDPNSPGLDPNAPNPFSNPGAPPLPGGDGLTEGSGPVPGVLPGGPVPPTFTDPSGHGSSFRPYYSHQIGVGDPNFVGPVDPADVQQANQIVQNQVQNSVGAGGVMPPTEEIEEHRRNILRQLRGN